MPESLEAESQTVRVTVDVVGLPAVMALARAARDLIDHAEPDSTGEWRQVRQADLDALEDAVAPIFPGAAS